MSSGPLIRTSGRGWGMIRCASSERYRRSDWTNSRRILALLTGCSAPATTCVRIAIARRGSSTSPMTGRHRSPTFLPSSELQQRCHSIQAGWESWPGIISRRRRIWAFRSSAWDCSTVRATSGRHFRPRGGRPRPTPSLIQTGFPCRSCAMGRGPRCSSGSGCRGVDCCGPTCGWPMWAESTFCFWIPTSRKTIPSNGK